VRILANFQPTEDVVLEPGDLLYLPPLWGHDGIAVGECMTCSVGFSAATATALTQGLLHQLADELEPPEPGAPERIYRDAGQRATANPGRLPDSLTDFARKSLERALRDPKLLQRALGVLISEPKPQVWFDHGEPLAPGVGAALDRRSRMAYDDHHVFINGEAFVARGRDARLVRRLADERRLTAAERAQLSQEASALLDDWAEAGWVRAAA
jgi:50S ribosomal protein L16 3-hydroxylase